MCNGNEQLPLPRIFFPYYTKFISEACMNGLGVQVYTPLRTDAGIIGQHLILLGSRHCLIKGKRLL